MLSQIGLSVPGIPKNSEAVDNRNVSVIKTQSKGVQERVSERHVTKAHTWMQVLTIANLSSLKRNAV